MKNYTAIVEFCKDTHLYVGYVPGLPGAHSQGANLDELNKNLQEVIELVIESNHPEYNSDFVGIQTIKV